MVDVKTGSLDGLKLLLKNSESIEGIIGELEDAAGR